ncbi:hypothetical protein LEMLEM_LOCUS21552 [Lemmus lemmus]
MMILRIESESSSRVNQMQRSTTKHRTKLWGSNQRERGQNI